MKNINKITFLEIKNYFNKNNFVFSSKISNDIEFYSINSLENATKKDLTFFTNISLIDKLKNTKALACLIDKKYIEFLPDNTFPIIVNNPYKAFALISNLFNFENKSNGIISNQSSISKKSIIESNVQIDSFVQINKNSHIHKNVIIESNCSIGPNVTIFDNSIIKANSTISNCTIGSNCIIKSGCVIGGEGFGFDPISKTRIQHQGDVIIKNNCNIGSNTTIDRAVFDSTIINENCFLDNLVQIAHNVILGSGAIVAAQSGIAGSTIIGENVLIGGQSGIAGHLIIGKNVKIAAKSGVTKNLNDNAVVAGFPAIDMKKWKLSTIRFNKIL